MKRDRIEAPRQSSLFKRNRPIVAILQLGKSGNRPHQYTYGMDAVCEELPINAVKIVTPRTINDCDIVLCSLCSTRDTLSLASEIMERPRSHLIVGGQGSYPFQSWRHLTHRIALGRVENEVEATVIGRDPLAWCYDYDLDPELMNVYTIRRARRLLKGEVSVGCGGTCKFCQYRATRPRFAGRYGNSSRGAPVLEDRWENVNAQPGQQTTALDGWSEATRKRIGKPVDDNQIIDKLSWCLSRINGIMRLKVYMIVGFPGETTDSITDDVFHFRQVLQRVRPGPGNGRIMMLVVSTPFSPEPMTPMENEPANISVNWRDVLLRDDIRCIFDSPHLNAFSLPQIPGPLTLYRRVAVNRVSDIDVLRKIAATRTIDEAVCAGGDICARGAGYRISKHLRVETMRDAEARG